MSTDTRIANARPKQLDVLQILTSSKGEIERALPKHLNGDRMLRIVTTEIRKNPKLKECDPYSFMGAVIQAAQLGLEVGSGLGHAYLVPYKRECTFISGYKGLVDLARRSGKIKAVQPYLVYAGDEFDEGVRNGVPYLHYKPVRTGQKRGEDDFQLGFCIALFDDGTPQWTVMEKWEIDAIRDGLKYTSDVWKRHYAEMAKKTTVRRLCKLLPQSPELVRVQESDDAAEAGAQGNHRVFVEAGVIEASYEVEPHDPQKTVDEQRAAANDYQLPSEKAAADQADAAERAKAAAEFNAAANAVIEKGGDPEAVVRRSLEKVLADTPAMIRAATAVLKQWRPTK